jgi:GNAT superfamily N-acetyltransferase
VTTTTYLEQGDRSEILEARAAEVEWILVEVAEPAPAFAQFLYAAVGADWFWLDRLHWTLEQWRVRMARAGTEMWVAWVAGAPAGFVELDSRGDDGAPPEVEIAYFGLLPDYLGRGLGGALLEAGLHRAWRMNDAATRPTGRVWVHTCTLDGPFALPNYEARGMSIYKTETLPQY